MANSENNTKEYKDERFEFNLFVNDNLVCKRNFKINNYIEGSMATLNFKERGDEIVRMIDNDLKSKSRVYTWYYFNEDDILDEFKDPLLDAWECTFKFVITCDKNVVYSRIWDGYAYPKAIRDRVDIANKFVKITTKEGMTYTFEKEEYFKNNADRLSPDMYVLKAMIMDKPDLLFAITKKICEVCSPRDEYYKNINEYTALDTYCTRDFQRNEDGSVKRDELGNPLFGKITDSKKYSFSLNMMHKRLVNNWGRAVMEKTKAYQNELAEFEKAIRKFS